MQARKLPMISICAMSRIASIRPDWCSYPGRSYRPRWRDGHLLHNRSGAHYRELECDRYRSPAVKSLVTILKEWLAFRKATVKRRLEYRLERVERRMHILEGRRRYLNIDEVIRIIPRRMNPRRC